MSTSVADIFEDYVESLQNLPSEIDQNMHELRSMDEEFQRIVYICYKEIYNKHRRTYSKLCKAAHANASGMTTPTPSVNLTAARQQLEKDYKLAVQKQDQKIDLTKKMYDLVSRHIERIDSQMAKSDLGEVDWMGGTLKKSHLTDDTSWRFDSSGSRKRLSPSGSLHVRKSRILHSSRPNPAIEQNGALPELDIDPNEPKYCYCNQVSFGDMVACDGENCEKEWFHYACVGLAEPPVGKWYCDDCAAEESYKKKIKSIY